MLEAIKYIFSRKEKLFLFYILVLVLIGSALELLGVAIFSPFIEAMTTTDGITSNQSFGVIYDLIGFSSVEQFLVAIAITIIIIYVVKNLFLTFEKNTVYKFSYGVQYRIARCLMEAYLSEPYTFHLNVNPAQLMRTIQVDADNFAKAIMHVIELIMELVVCVALAVYLFVVSPMITVIIAGALFVGVSGYVFLSKKYLRNVGEKLQKNSGEIFMQDLNKIYFITNKTNLSQNNLKNLTLKPRIKNSNGQISSQENIRIFEYKSIFRRKKNSEEKISHNIFKEKINIVKLPNFSIKQLKKNNSYDSIPYKINLQNKFNHVSLSCSNQNITNQSKIQYYNINQKKNKNLHFRIKHYSPNNMLKNKYVNLFSKNGFAFSNIMNKRSNSDSKKKKVLNYNNINLSDNDNSRASIHKPKNLNNLNNYNYIPLETKCYNFIKI